MDWMNTILGRDRVLSRASAYVLWLLFGPIGGHQIYLGRPRAAFAQMCLLLIGPAFYAQSTPASKAVGMILLMALIIWLAIDLLLIPRWVRAHNAGRASKTSSHWANLTR